MEGIAIVAGLAGLIEGVQEVVLGKYLKGIWMQLVSWVLGVALCFLCQIGFFTTLGLVESVDKIRFAGDMVVTGLIVGLGANAAHLIINRFRE